MSDPLPSPIVPLDVAVVDDDLLWRSEVMNACRPLYTDDFVVVGEALDHIDIEMPCVLVVGPNALPNAEPLIGAAKASHPNLRILVVDPVSDDGRSLSGLVGSVDGIVAASASTAELVAEVQRLHTDSAEQAARARPTATGGDRQTRLIVVTGAKAGEGATVTAVHLAMSLQSRAGLQVTLVDTDPTFGDIAMRLELRPPEHAKSSTPLTLSPSTIRDLTMAGPHGLQVFIPPLAHHALHALPPPAIATVLETLQPDADVIVLDATFFLVLQSDLLALSDRLLVVTTPGLTDLKNASIAGSLLDRADHVAAVVNRPDAGPHQKRRKAAEPPTREIQHAIGLPVVASLPHTEGVSELPDQRSESEFSGAIDRLADKVLDAQPFR